MILSNAAYDKLRGKKDYFLESGSFDPMNIPDWPFFTNLNAHEIPGHYIELEE